MPYDSGQETLIEIGAPKAKTLPAPERTHVEAQTSV